MNQTPLSEKLRAWRAERGWTRAQAAEKLGVKLKTLQCWEQGFSSPTGIGLTALLHFIGAPELDPANKINHETEVEL